MFKVGTLVVDVKADIANLRAGLKVADTEVKSFVGKLASSEKDLKKVSRGILYLGIAATAVTAIVVRTFANFEQSIANTASILGVTGSALKRIGEAARIMGKTTVFTAYQAADAMYYLASAGFNTEQTIAALQGTLDLAAATAHDLADTTFIVVSTLNAFNLAAEEATRVANVFAAVISSTQATMDRLLDSMKYIGPVANTMNISLEETSATLGALYNAGLAASQAGTSLRMALLSLASPSEKAKKAIKDLGLNLEDLDPSVNSIIDIIGKLEEAQMGATAAAIIFGRRAVTAMLVLRDYGSKALTDLTKKITATRKATEMAAIQINTLKGSIKLLRSAVQEVAIQMGEGVLLKVIKGLIDGFKVIALWITELPRGLKNMAGVALALGSVMLLLTGAIFYAAGSIGIMVMGLGAMGVAASSILPILGLVVGALSALGLVVWALGNSFRDQAKEAELAISKYKGQAEALKEFVEEQKELQKQLASPILATHNKAMEELEEITRKIVELHPYLAEGFEENGKIALATTNKILAYASSLKAYADMLEEQKKKELREELKKVGKEYNNLTEELEHYKKLLQTVEESERKTGRTGIILDTKIGWFKSLNTLQEEYNKKVKEAAALSRKMAQIEMKLNKDLIASAEEKNKESILALKERIDWEISLDKKRANLAVSSIADEKKRRLAEVEKAYDEELELAGEFTDGNEQQMKLAETVRTLALEKFNNEKAAINEEFADEDLAAQQALMDDIARLEIGAILDVWEKKRAIVLENARKMREKYEGDAEMEILIAAQLAQDLIDIENQRQEEIGRIRDRAARRTQRDRNKLEREEEKARRERLAAVQDETDLVVQAMYSIGEASVLAATGAAEAWKNALSTMVDATMDYYMAKIRMMIAEYLAAMNWWAAAWATAKLGMVSAAGTWAKGAIARAQEGAFIPGKTKRGSFVNVGENFTPEIILPLNKAPATASILAGAGVESGSQDININVDLTGSFVSVNDENTVDAFYEKVILPATRRVTERFRPINAFEEIN